MSMSAPQSGPDEEYREEQMFQKLHLASEALKKETDYVLIRSKVAQLVDNGILKYVVSERSTCPTVSYYVSPTNDSGRNSVDNEVFRDEYTNDFDGNKGFIPCSYAVHSYDQKGNRVHSIFNSTEGTTQKEFSQTFYPNGNLRTCESHDRSESKSHDYEYDENQPGLVIYHRVRDHKTGETKVEIDQRIN